jgi:TonB family protein
MGALPASEPAGIRYAAYLGELHEFLATSGIPFGSPSDLNAVVGRLQQHGAFADDLSSLVRSFILRQGGSMPHAELLEILSLAIGGPELAPHPQNYSDSLRELLRFIAGAQGRPWNVPPNAPGEVVPFPGELPAANREPKVHPAAIRSAVAPLPVAALEIAGPSRRRGAVWIALASATALAAALVVFARMRTPSETFRIQPVPASSTASEQQRAAPIRSPGISQQAPTPMQIVNPPVTSAPRPAKPSAYGEVLNSRSQNRPHPASGWANSQSGQPNPATAQAAQPGPSASGSQGATQSLATAPVFAPYGTTTGAAQPPAPIFRRPALSDPDSYIAGEMPAGTTSPTAHSYFTVSSGVMAANLISSADPEYPLLARLAHVQGQVILQAVIAKDGTVEATRVLRGNHLLRGAAEDAVRRFRYRPYRVDGRPVDVATIVTVDFHGPDDAQPQTSQ